MVPFTLQQLFLREKQVCRRAVGEWSVVILMLHTHIDKGIGARNEHIP